MCNCPQWVSLEFLVDSELQPSQVLYTYLHRAYMYVPVHVESYLYYLQYLIKCKFSVSSCYPVLFME